MTIKEITRLCRVYKKFRTVGLNAFLVRGNCDEEVLRMAKQGCIQRDDYQGAYVCDQLLKITEEQRKEVFAKI